MMASVTRAAQPPASRALEALARAVSPEARAEWGRAFVEGVVIPAAALGLFLLLWHGLAKNVQTSLGQLPGPVQVWEQAVNLLDEHRAEREKARAFYERQAKRNAEKRAEDPGADVKVRPYAGKATFLDQVLTSLATVAAGFLIGSVVAVPLGILCGLSSTVYRALNPLVQVFKPVSPLAWLPLVTLVVSAVYVSEDPLFSKSFLNSAITVTLCSLWPTIINTTVGASSIDRDLINVSRVLRLGWWTKLWKIVLPSAVPMMFAGLRVSLGIAWMVLIAAEMLAQNPGLGKFVWDEFQNGSSSSLGRIMVAVIAIGLIGFLLDRLMLSLQRLLSWDRGAVLR